MRNQSEFLYVLLFLSIAGVIIILSFLSLTYFSRQQINIIKFDSLNTITNYFLGYLKIAFTQKAYVESRTSGLQGWGKNIWAYVPCSVNPPSCEEAVKYYNENLKNALQGSLELGIDKINNEKIYYPYNFRINFTSNYSTYIVGKCSDIYRGKYDYYFYTAVEGIKFTINSSDASSIFDWKYIINVTDNPALFLYRKAYEFTVEGYLSQCSIEDCINAVVSGNRDQRGCAISFEQFVNDPDVKCNEFVYVFDACKKPCKELCHPENLRCTIRLLCNHTGYNVLFNGILFPQAISFGANVYAANDTVTLYQSCVYNCTIVVDNTTKKVIESLCKHIDTIGPVCYPTPDGPEDTKKREENGKIIYTCKYYIRKSWQVSCCPIVGCPDCCPSDPLPCEEKFSPNTNICGEPQ